MKKLTQPIYTIKDIWLTLTTLRKITFFGLFFYIVLLLIMIFVPYEAMPYSQKFKYFSLVYWGLFVVYFMQVFFTFNKGYVIDLEKEEFRFPATDVENSLLGILTFKKYRDYARVKRIALGDISDIYIDRQSKKVFSSTSNKTSKIVYTINIVGFHGSNNLDFSSRQKRDEVRGILVQAAKQVKVRIDDRKSAEFS